MKNNIKRVFFDNNRIIFVIASILFGLCFVFEHPHGDDTTIAIVESLDLNSIFTHVMNGVKNSYSSSIVSVITTLLNNTPRFVFVFSMMLTMYILLESMRYLFSKDNKLEKYINVFIALAVLSYSYVDMQSAGWITTTTCYLIPEAFALFALRPIKKMLHNEEYKTWEYILCIVSTLIASNQPQGMAFLLICYMAAIIYGTINHKIDKYSIIIFALIIINMYFVLTSNWNKNRVVIETIKRMPNIEMYNIITKIEIGMSSTFGWLFFGDNMFLMLTLIIFTFFIFIKYKSIFYRVLSIIPELLVLLLRRIYLSNLSINAFEISPKELGSSNFGLFNIDSVNTLSTYLLFFAMCIIVIIVIIQIVLLTNNNKELIIVLVLLATGFGSRLALAFTPNVFASQQRTFIYLNFSVIATCIYVYAINIPLINEKHLPILSRVFCVISILPLGYFFAYVYNYGGSSLFDLLR